MGSPSMASRETKRIANEVRSIGHQRFNKSVSRTLLVPVLRASPRRIGEEIRLRRPAPTERLAKVGALWFLGISRPSRRLFATRASRAPNRRRFGPPRAFRRRGRAPAPMLRHDGPRPRTPKTRRLMHRAQTASRFAPLASGRGKLVEGDFSGSPAQGLDGLDRGFDLLLPPTRVKRDPGDGAAAPGDRHGLPALRLVEALANRNVGLRGLVFAHSGTP